MLAPRILIFIAIFVVYDKLAAIFLILTTHCIVTAYRVITWGNEQHLLSRIVCKYQGNRCKRLFSTYCIYWL